MQLKSASLFHPFLFTSRRHNDLETLKLKLPLFFIHFSFTFGLIIAHETCKCNLLFFILFSFTLRLHNDLETLELKPLFSSFCHSLLHSIRFETCKITLLISFIPFSVTSTLFIILKTANVTSSFLSFSHSLLDSMQYKVQTPHKKTLTKPS